MARRAPKAAPVLPGLFPLPGETITALRETVTVSRETVTACRETVTALRETAPEVFVRPGQRLDCLTPAGRPFKERERALLGTMAAIWQADVVGVPAQDCGIDGIFSRQGQVWRLAEVKARTAEWTLAEIRRLGSYLVSFDKLVTGRTFGRRFGVDYMLVAGLPDALIWWHVSDRHGQWRSRLQTRRVTTQASVNGGTKEEACAFLSLADMVLELERTDD